MILQLLQTSKVKPNLANQASRLVTQVCQWMMMCLQPLKMDQLLKTIPGEGTYTVAPDGTVTFSTR